MANNLQIYIKEYDDTVWTEVTDRVVKADFKLRSGFSSLGGSVNLSKLDITYRASNLAVAAIFHTTAKQIRIKKDGNTVWEGYTERSSSVSSTNLPSLAWVKISAYPYIHALEGIKATEDEVYYNVYMSHALQTGSSLLNILWNAMISKCASPYKECLQDLYTVVFPTILVQRDIVVLEKDTELLDTFLGILKQYTYVMTVDGFTISFLQPYNDDYRIVREIPYTGIQTSPTIKTSPYVVEKQPVATLTRIKTKSNCRVYSLADSDTENAEEELYIGKSHPSEGDYEEVSYRNDDVENDSCKLIYAKNPTMTYKARYSDNSADAVLRQDVLELGPTSAKIKLTNTNTTLSCYLNQLWITAETAYFADTSLRVSTAAADTLEEEEETTEWLSDEDNAKAYCNALKSEQKANTASITFKSAKLGDSLKPNDIIKIGDIGAVYLIKQVTENLSTGEKEYTCGIFSLTEGASALWKKEGQTGIRGATGKDGAFYQFEIESTNGVYFRSSSSLTILISRIYKNGAEEDSAGSTYNYTWKKVKANGVEDTSFTPELPTEAQLTTLGIASGSNKAIVIRANSVDELATYYSVVEEK